MSFSVNEKTLAAVFSNDNGEITALLQELIDEELAKEEMNTALVDECVEAILDLESGEPVVSLCSYQILMEYCRSNAFKKSVRFKRAALVAALVAIATAVVFTTSPALAEQTKSVVHSIIASLGLAADSTDTGNSEIVSIYLLPKEEISFTVKSEEEIVPEKFDIVAVDKNNFKKHIPLSECKVQKERMDSAHILLTFSYEGCACSLMYELEVAE